MNYTGHPTVMYNVSVAHDGRIINVAGPHPGARNDKTAVRFDNFVMSVHQRKVYQRTRWNRYAADGTTTEERGVWLLCDGGYHRWRVLQCPVKWDHAASKVAWSKWVESVRKDVECVFGRLKGRFRCLKIPCRFQTQEAVDNQFRACCAIYNMLHEIDGLGAGQRWTGALTAATLTQSVRLFGNDAPYDDGYDSEVLSDEDLDRLRQRYAQQHERVAARVGAAIRLINHDFDASHVGFLAPVGDADSDDEGATEVQIEPGWAELRHKLVAHYIQATARREVQWIA